MRHASSSSFLIGNLSSVCAPCGGTSTFAIFFGGLIIFCCLELHPSALLLYLNLLYTFFVLRNSLYIQVLPYSSCSGSQRTAVCNTMDCNVDVMHIRHAARICVQRKEKEPEPRLPFGGAASLVSSLQTSSTASVCKEQRKLKVIEHQTQKQARNNQGFSRSDFTVVVCSRDRVVMASLKIQNISHKQIVFSLPSTVKDNCSNDYTYTYIQVPPPQKHDATVNGSTCDVNNLFVDTCRALPACSPSYRQVPWQHIDGFLKTQGWLLLQTCSP